MLKTTEAEMLRFVVFGLVALAMGINLGLGAGGRSRTKQVPLSAGCHSLPL